MREAPNLGRPAARNCKTMQIPHNRIHIITMVILSFLCNHYFRISDKKVNCKEMSWKGVGWSFENFKGYRTDSEIVKSNLWDVKLANFFLFPVNVWLKGVFKFLKACGDSLSLKILLFISNQVLLRVALGTNLNCLCFPEKETSPSWNG